ncbi:uncharacterized protein FOMMEDRAFT_22837 [Fomitiporia mediterranea MF3/22]|uniref:uncharacterized protein n=1 Tax=Fomitiporia mediterranea (strain MF3/22) TaxID=694068 RepID=UPI000440874E|nr:uncharacterized protein FOMMEDRAFT_22837 [Fomitiporia mediterranea MF3/22]EJC99747.1 hypothetical protein FOMMEDRAFT_22837 [Fomitiporia mediterranea MF3/22]
MSSSLSGSQLAEAALHLQATKYYAIASFAMLVYDIFLTFSTEVEKIWKRRFTAVTVLWVMIRWIYLAGIIVIYVSYFDPDWTSTVCAKYVKFPGYLLIYQRIVTGMIFILRTYCLYQRSWVAVGIISIFLAAEITVKFVTLEKWAAMVHLPPQLSGCFLAVAPENASKYVWHWITELFTDAVIMLLTAYRSYRVYTESIAITRTPLWITFLRDGFLYFFVMFSANVCTVTLYLILPVCHRTFLCPSFA